MKALKRVLLKLSGEALSGGDAFGITTDGLKQSVQEILPTIKLFSFIPNSLKSSIFLPFLLNRFKSIP